jgi:hypothetical protein
MSKHMMEVVAFYALRLVSPNAERFTLVPLPRPTVFDWFWDFTA